MFFIVDKKTKIIFGWTPKCGCSLVKSIAWYFIEDNIHPAVHTERDFMNLPDDIENYTVIIVGRNPYLKVVSGFLDKYKINGSFRHLWKHATITFNDFVNEILQHNWNVIDFHHVALQTGDKFNEEKIMKSKQMIIYDIANIDYEYIGQLYNKKIPQEIIERKHNHERKKYDQDFCDYVYNLHMDDYFSYNVKTKYFYNEEIKTKIRNFYKNDFLFFQKHGFDYENDNIF